MTTSPHRLLAILLLLGGLLALPSARAAESYENCAGFIDSVPATIGTQGVWCLRHDLSTAIASGYAITIAANNVTIDCNGYKLGGLAAGAATEAMGIYAANRQNGTVRNCNIRGFKYGIRLDGNGAGHLLEDNRFDNNLYAGILVSGEHHLIRRNRVYDTGGSPLSNAAYGILASGTDIIDNTVFNVFATGTDTTPIGIYLDSGNGHMIRDNIVSGLIVNGSGYGIGIGAPNGTRVDRNHVTSPSGTVGYAILGSDEFDVFCIGNTITGFSTAIHECHDAGGNSSL